MPTGYTAAVADGTIAELEPFVLQCARAFGACVSMRDTPWNEPIPERFEPSDYHSKRLVELRTERDRLNAMKSKQADDAAANAYGKARVGWDKRQRDKAEQRERYQAMIAKVEDYSCPHDELKEFMLEQLRTGMDFDCPDRVSEWDKPPVIQTGAQWRRNESERVERDILHHATEHAKEVERTESRNVWIAALRASLKASDRD